MQPILPDKGGSLKDIPEVWIGSLTLDQGRPRLKQAIADAYSPFFGKTINPETEVSITTGANEGESPE